MPKKPSAQPAPQQPVAQVAPAPQQESWTPPPNLHEAAADHKAPADILHNLATHAIGNPNDEHSDEIVSNLSDNPSIQPHTVTALYNHLKGKNDEAEHDAMFKLASHPNAPASLAEQHVQHMHEAAKSGNYGYTVRHSLNEAILGASKKSGVDEDMLKRIVKDYVDNDTADESGSYNPVAHVDPAFYMQMLLERPEMHPEAEHLTPEEKAHNSKVKRIDATALENLAVSEKHTPETLSTFAQYLAQPDRYGQNKDRWRKEFVQKQKQIPTEHLDRLFKPDADGWDERETNEAILEHPNVSPTLLASVARSEGEGYRQESLKNAAFANPNLPDEVIRAVVDGPNARNTDMRRLVSNPKLSADDMRKLYERGDDAVKKKVMLSEHAPDDLKVRYWQASGKSTEAARTMLESKTLPAQVLKDIVNHKNQNVALEALKHPSANEEVLETAVKRKAAAVADAAARHPLLAGKYFDQRVREGKMKGSELFFNKANRQAVPPERMAEYTRLMHERYKDTSDDNISKLKENREDFYKVKAALAQSPDLTTAEKNQHLDDIASEYRKVVSPTQDSWRIGQDSHAQTMARSVIDGAKRGHEKSEEALLTTPKMISSADLSEGHRPEFLAKVYDSLPDRDNYGETIREIASNPVTTEDTFQRITSERDFYDRPDDYVTGKRDDMSTVFDDRWANDPQRDQKFRALSERPEARPAVVRSNSAPKDAWRKAFEEMDETHRFEFLSNNADHAVKMADDELFVRMLNGRYNGELGGGRYGRSHNHVQVAALKEAGPDFVDDIANYVAASAHPDAPDNVKMDPKEFANSLSEEIYSHPSYEKVQNAAFMSQPSLGIELRAKKLLKEAKTYADERSPETLNRYMDHLRNDATDGMTPEQKKMAFGDRIHAMVEALRDYGRSYDRSSVQRLLSEAKPKETGALDFLADGGFSADPDIDDHIRSLAMSEGLISDKKIAEVMNTSPAAFEESLKALKPIEKAERIRQSLGGADLHPDLLDPIVAHLTNATLNPAYKGYHSRGDTKPEHVTTASQLAMNLGRGLAQAGQFGNIGVAAAKILKDSIDPNRGGMRKDDRVKVMKALQQGAEAVAPQAKGQIAAWIYKTAHQMGVGEMLPGAMANTLAKEALKNNDVETLLQLADTPNPPSNITNAITNMVSKPELLSDDQMRTVPYLLQKIQVTPKAVRKVVDAYLSRPALQGDKASLFSGLGRMIGARKYTSSSNAQDIEGETIRAVMMDPAHELSQKVLADIVRKSDFSDNVKAAYLGMPDQVDNIDVKDLKLDQTVANDPEVMQKSHSGWRLGTLVQSVHSLNKENRSILVDRLSLYQGDDIGLDRPEAYKNIVMARGTVSDDCVKLYRSMNPQEKADFLDQLSGSISGGYDDYNVDGVAAMMPHVAADMKDDAEKVPMVSDEYEGHEAIVRVSRSIEGAAGLATKLAKTAANRKSNDSKSSVQDYAGEVLSSAEIMADKISHAHRSDPNFYKGTTATSSRSLMHALSHVASTKDHAGLSSQKMLDVFSKVRDVFSEAMGTRDPSAVGSEQIGVFAANWIENAKVQPEHWADAFKKIPEMQFYAAGRENVEPEMYKALDIKQMLETEPKDAFETFSSILTKLDPTRAHEVVPDMLDKVEQNIGAREPAIMAYRRNYSQLVTTAVDRHPSTLTARHLREVLSREGIYDDSRKRIEGMAYDRGAGGREFFDQGLKEMKDWADKKDSYALDVATNLAGSPFLNEEDAKNFSGLIKAKFGSDTGKMNLIMKLLDNQQVPEQIVRGLYNDVSQGHKEGNIGDGLRKKVVEKTIKHRNLPRDTFFQLYDETKDMYPSKVEVGKPFNPALVNPRFGGELFRSLPLSVPKEVPNVDESKLVAKATHGEKSEKVRQALQFIPPEGITWPQFKKAAPRLENVPEIKQMFMAKNNKPVKPEDVVAEMRKHAPDEYHVTYTRWNGSQRHLQEDRDSPPNLVVQLNTGADMESKLNQDPKLWNFFQYVQKSANHVHNDQIGGHPVTPHIASWVRVDTSGGKDGWVIEEFQSDFSAKLRKQLKHVFSDRSTIDLDGQKYTQEEANAMVKHIEKTFSSWVDASYQAVEELARKHGVKKLFVHGQGVRRELSGVSQDKHVEVFDEAYERQPQKRGFKAVQYTDYPKHSKSMAERVVAGLAPEEKVEALKCWMKELT